MIDLIFIHYNKIDQDIKVVHVLQVASQDQIYLFQVLSKIRCKKKNLLYISTEFFKLIDCIYILVQVLENKNAICVIVLIPFAW